MIPTYHESTYYSKTGCGAHMTHLGLKGQSNTPSNCLR
jgi:hypothetical protein